MMEYETQVKFYAECKEDKAPLFPEHMTTMVAEHNPHYNEHKSVQHQEKTRPTINFFYAEHKE